MAAKKEGTKEKFGIAKTRVEKFTKRPSHDELLELYSLYKQATDGDATGPRPGMLDLKGRAKYDAWAKRKGISAEDAMKKYIAVVDQLETKLG